MSNETESDGTKAVKLDPEPQSTWGANPAAKAAWDAKYGPAARKSSEAKS